MPSTASLPPAAFFSLFCLPFDADFCVILPHQLSRFPARRPVALFLPETAMIRLLLQAEGRVGGEGGLGCVGGVWFLGCFFCLFCGFWVVWSFWLLVFCWWGVFFCFFWVFCWVGVVWFFGRFAFEAICVSLVAGRWLAWASRTHRQWALCQWQTLIFPTPSAERS